MLISQFVSLLTNSMHNYMERCIVLFAFIISLLSVTLSEQSGRPPAENHCVKGLHLYETIIFFICWECVWMSECVSHTFREKACAKWILTLPLWSPFSRETANHRADIRPASRPHKQMKKHSLKRCHSHRLIKWLGSNSRKLHGALMVKSH